MFITASKFNTTQFNDLFHRHGAGKASVIINSLGEGLLRYSGGSTQQIIIDPLAAGIVVFALYPYFQRITVPVEEGSYIVYVERTDIFEESETVLLTDGVNVYPNSISSIVDDNQILLDSAVEATVTEGALLSHVFIQNDVPTPLIEAFYRTYSTSPEFYFVISTPSTITVNLRTILDSDQEKFRANIINMTAFHLFDTTKTIYPFYRDYDIYMDFIGDVVASRKLTYNTLKENFELEGDVNMLDETVSRTEMILKNLPDLEELHTKIRDVQYEWAIIDYSSTEGAWTIMTLENKLFYVKELTVPLVYEEILAIVTLGRGQYRAVFLPAENSREFKYGIKQYPNSPVVFYCGDKLYIHIPPIYDNLPTKLRLYTR